RQRHVAFRLDLALDLAVDPQAPRGDQRPLDAGALPHHGDLGPGSSTLSGPLRHPDLLRLDRLVPFVPFVALLTFVAFVLAAIVAPSEHRASHPSRAGAPGPSRGRRDLPVRNPTGSPTPLAGRSWPPGSPAPPRRRGCGCWCPAARSWRSSGCPA